MTATHKREPQDTGSRINPETRADLEMSTDACEGLPPFHADLAKLVMGGVVMDLQNRGDTPRSYWYTSSLKTRERHTNDFGTVSPSAYAEVANEAHLHAVSINADFMVVVIDQPGRPRTIYVGIETRQDCYAATFRVVQGKDRIRELGSGKFIRVPALRAPFDELLAAHAA
jgi:hypothetical protein